MRIVLICDFYRPYLGGVEQHVATLAAALHRRGHDVHVATLRGRGLDEVEDDDGVTVHRLRSTTARFGRLFASTDRPWAPPLPDPEATAALRRLVAQVRPDVVHVHDWLGRSYLPLRRWAARRFGTRFVSSLHYYTLTCAKKDLMRVTRHDDSSGPQRCSGPAPLKCWRCAGTHYGIAKGAVTAAGNAIGGTLERRTVDALVAVSNATAEKNHAATSATVIGNPVPPAPATDFGIAPRLARLPQQPFIMFVGDLRPMKGVDVLLRAHQLLRSELGEAAPALVLIGKRWPDTPAALSSDHPPPGVVVEERWPNTAVLAAWGRAAVAAVPSVWDEPFGIVVVEALRAGVPVVASAVGGIPEIVRDGVEGVLVPPGDDRALAHGLSELVVDTVLRHRLSAAARRRATAYDPDHIVEQVLEVYNCQDHHAPSIKM